MNIKVHYASFEYRALFIFGHMVWFPHSLELSPLVLTDNLQEAVNEY